MVYTIGALMILGILWFLVRTQERSLDSESRFLIESHRLAHQPASNTRKRSR
jgi:hypothetical protein